MTWTSATKRRVAALGILWIGFVILACTDDSTSTVRGDVASGGGCPPGATCAPGSSSSEVAFEASKVPDRLAPGGELPPIALGTRTRVRLVWGDAREVFGYRLEAEGMEVIEPEMGGGAFLAGESTGTFTVRALDPEDVLYDQIRIRVERPASVRMVPRFFFGHAIIAEDAEWRVWPATELYLVEETRSAEGELLVSLDEGEASLGESATAPSSGTLEVRGEAGRFGQITRFPVAASVEGVRAFHYGSDAPALLYWHTCIFGAEDGDPIIGAPITLRAEGDESSWGLSPDLPCIGWGDEVQTFEVTVEGGGEVWPLSLPAIPEEPE